MAGSASFRGIQRGQVLPTGARGSAPAPAAAVPTGRSCVCGHGRDAHEHYRKGTDCALCACTRYTSRFRSRFLPKFS